MNKIKQWLRRWLGVEEVEEKSEAAREYAYKIDLFYNHRIDALDKRLGKTEDVIGRTIRAGFDHHLNNPSWIVLAWREDNGREHVHFYEVHKEYISQIKDMLSSLKRENVIIDTHPQIYPQFKW